MSAKHIITMSVYILNMHNIPHHNHVCIYIEYIHNIQYANIYEYIYIYILVIISIHPNDLHRFPRVLKKDTVPSHSHICTRDLGRPHSDSPTDSFGTTLDSRFAHTKFRQNGPVDASKWHICRCSRCRWREESRSLSLT